MGKNKNKRKFAKYEGIATCRTYDVKGGTPTEAHGQFDGPACISAAIRSHIAEMQGEGYHSAFSASIPMDREPLFGPAHVFPPHGFQMKIKLYWLAEVSAAAIDDFEWCMYQMSQFYLERVHHEWVQSLQTPQAPAPGTATQ